MIVIVIARKSLKRIEIAFFIVSPKMTTKGGSLWNPLLSQQKQMVNICYLLCKTSDILQRAPMFQLCRNLIVKIIHRCIVLTARHSRCPVYFKKMGGGGVYYYYSFCQAFFRFPIKIMISYMNLSHMRLEPVFNSKFN